MMFIYSTEILCLNYVRFLSQSDSKNLHSLTSAQWRHLRYRASDSEPANQQVSFNWLKNLKESVSESEIKICELKWQSITEDFMHKYFCNSPSWGVRKRKIFQRSFAFISLQGAKNSNLVGFLHSRPNIDFWQSYFRQILTCFFFHFVLF